MKLTDEDVRAALHEKGDLMDARLVVLRADAPLARPRTPLDVKVETDLALFEDLVGTGPEWQQLPARLHRAAQGLRGRVRTEVEGAVVLDPSRVVDSWVLLGDRKLQVEVILDRKSTRLNSSHANIS